MYSRLAKCQTMLLPFLRLRRSFPLFSRLVHSRPAVILKCPPQHKTLNNPRQTEKARQWISFFRDYSIPRKLVNFTFSRSSGPGGQNVNKVNTKATLRCSLDKRWMPPWAMDGLIKSPYYVASTSSLVISSSTYRSQPQNVDECLRKLHECIMTASTAPIQNEPSAEQSIRVEKLVKADNARRRFEKAKRSLIKSDRKGGGSWD